MSDWLRSVPLLLLPALLYGAVALTMDQASVRASLDEVFFAARLPSGAVFEVTRGHGVMLLAAGLLFLEVIKSTAPTPGAIVEISLAFLAFCVSLGLFLLAPAFGTIEFALIMITMLIDFMAGFIVMTVSARRDVAFGA